MASSHSPLDPIIPYLEHSSLPISSLLQGLEPSALPLACQAVIEAADSHSLPGLRQDVLAFQGLEKQRREELVSEIIEEVTPVTEVRINHITLHKPTNLQPVECWQI